MRSALNKCCWSETFIVCLLEMFLIAYCLLEVVLDPLWSEGLLLGELRGEWNMFPMSC